ncbi:hypothetical protein J4771_01185 [Candidatus Kaistella beijingensis]|uniref:hypothetical protein n=1 Tax=Candidatus Kaistella beijingensis TaxID=2820270 RepID=UPI001CC39A78|nr:hypothetical protein [Candidatus Kaistella beijingensis]UBB89995.1 hypothetical protein J4771_01185 [Candidatus Kaistella beijingensis]
MKSAYFFFFIFNVLNAQITEKKHFDIKLFNELSKTSLDSLRIEYKKNDSLVIMMKYKNDIPRINIVKGNYAIFYEFYPYLYLKAKRQGIFGKAHLSEFPIGNDVEYSENGSITRKIDWNNVPFDDGIPGPKLNILNIDKLMKQNYRVDVFNDNLWDIRLRQNEKTKMIFYEIDIIDGEKHYFEYKINGDSGFLISKKRKRIKIPKGLQRGK